MSRVVGVASGRAAAAAVLAAAVLWGTVGAAQELGAATAQPFTVAAVRTVGAAVALVAVLLIARRGRDLVLVVRTGRGAALASGVAIAVFQVGLLTGVREAGVALGTLLAIGSAPAWAGTFAVVAGRRPGVRWMVATMLTVAGAGVLLLFGTQGGDGQGVVTPSPVGIVSSLVAGAAYAAYATASKRVLAAGATGPAMVAVVFIVAALVLSPLLFVGDIGWVATPTGGTTAVWLTVATVGGYLLSARGLRWLDAPTVTTLTLAEPLTATGLALVAVGERLTGAGAVGAALLLAGLTLVSGRSAPNTVGARGA